MDSIERLLQTPYWIIDILPTRVPEKSGGQYFAVERYFLTERLPAIRQKHIDLILKLNCYIDVSIDGEVNPAPDKIAAVMNERCAYIMIGDSMILSEPDDTHMTLFNPDVRLLERVREIAVSEGLYVWRGAE